MLREPRVRTGLTRFLHNSTAFALQRRFFLSNLPFVILPIQVEAGAPSPASASVPSPVGRTS